MTVRTVTNVTSENLTREVRAQTLERVTDTVVMAENNANIDAADITAGNPIGYAGNDYIPSGQDQYDLNA